MDKKAIQEILAHPYQRKTWYELLQSVFNWRPQVAEPNSLPLSDNDKVSKAWELGSFYTSDERLVGLYELEVLPGVKLERNKVGLRELLRQVYKYEVDAALVVFVQGEKWRLSYISEIRSRYNDLDILVKTPARRFTYFLGKDEKVKTASERMGSLAGKSLSLDQIREAFSVERLSNDFFKEYKFHYEKRFADHLLKNKLHVNEAFSGNPKLVRDFCKRLLGRIIFLYFVQKKGWLGAEFGSKDWNGPGDFLLKLFLQSERDNFYASSLAQLFFKVLNEKRPEDLYRMPNGEKVKIPYLNGGLFYDHHEPNPEKILFPEEFFHNPLNRDLPNTRGLFDFLDSYNFTIYEDSPEDQTVAVDPEMLGHIFENLLEENREKGAIYTPREIVHFMCQESLTSYLNTKTNPENNEKKNGHIKQLVSLKTIEGVDEKLLHDIDYWLDQVKICDPAIGSGAFPMGLLQEIFFIKEAIQYPKGYKAFSPAAVKERIIQKSIYGVDMDANAVDIARLRFWLSLIVDEESPRPLPNLDYKIVVGDSLVPKLKGKIVEIEWEPKSTIKSNEHIRQSSKEQLSQIIDEKKRFFSLSENSDGGIFEKETFQLKIRNHTISLLIYQMADLQLRVKGGLDTQETLFGTSQEKKKQREERERRIEDYENLIRDLQALKNDSAADLEYFDWKLNFAEILHPDVAEHPGFDIVIANPPYMRVQGQTEHLKEEKAYIESAADFRDVAKGEFANLFVVLALRKLAKADASCCFIFPHKFFNAESGKQFREFLQQGRFMDKITHFGANRVFNDADTYVCIASFSPKATEGFYLQKMPYPCNIQERLGLDELYTWVDNQTLKKASRLYGGNQWVFFSKAAEYEIFEQIYQDAIRLESLIEIFVGLQTSNDKLYVLEVEKEEGNFYWGCNGLSDRLWKVEKTFFKPLLKGRDVQQYGPLETTAYVFFPYKVEDGKASFVGLDELEANCPATFQFVVEQEGEFKARESGKLGRDNSWYRHGRENNLGAFETLKLSSMEICTSRPNVTLNHNHLYHTTTVYSWVKKPDFPMSYECLLAIANSSLMWWFLKNTGDTLQGDARRLKSNYLNPFPVPKDRKPEAEKAISDLVSWVLYLKDEDNNPVRERLSNSAMAQYLVQVIDACVLELYFEDHMKERKINVLEFVQAESVAFQPEYPERLDEMFSKWQESKSEVRNRLLLMQVRSSEIIQLIKNP